MDSAHNKQIRITISNDQGIVLDQFSVTDLSFQKMPDTEDDFECVGRPMSNASVIDRIQKAAFVNGGSK